jgi:hypothetical protein
LIADTDAHTLTAARHARAFAPARCVPALAPALALARRDATVRSGPVRRPFSPNPEPEPGPVRALRLNPEPLWGPVRFGSGSGPIEV